MVPAQIIKEANKAHALRSKLQKQMKREKGIMDDRQKAFDEHLQQMRKELEGAEAAAAKRVADAEAKCSLSKHKCEVSINI
jgi:hypothetical protein